MRRLELAGRTDRQRDLRRRGRFGGAVTIEYCEVHDHPNGRGIGVTASGTWPARIEYCEVYNCSTTSNGGGISLHTSSDGSTLSNNEVTGNTADSHYEAKGGGIHVTGSTGCTLSSNPVTGNSADGRGGGIQVYESTWLSFAGDPDTGTYNTICGNDGYCIHNNTTFNPNGSSDVDARYVRWCTDDVSDIQARVYDYFDNASKGFAFWQPFVGLEQGDLNCDGGVDAFDIDAFVLTLTDPDAYHSTYPCCCIEHADCNGDGLIDAFDVDPFVELLTGGG